MKNKGFTLVELLAVIVILALLITIAVPSVSKMSAKIQTNMFCSKVENIEKAAQLWGNDNYDFLDKQKAVAKDLSTGGNVNYDHAYIVDIKELVQKNYQKKDDEKPEDGESFVIDPRDKSSIMNKRVLVYIKNSRVYADYQFDSLADANACRK